MPLTSRGPMAEPISQNIFKIKKTLLTLILEIFEGNANTETFKLPRPSLINKNANTKIK